MGIVNTQSKFIAAVASIVVVLALGAAGIAIYGFFPSRLSAQLEDWSKANLGRSLTVNGKAHVDLWPASIRLENVSLSAPETMARAPMLSAKELRIATSFSAILARRLEIGAITLVEPEFNVLTNSSSAANWMFDGAKNLPVINLENGSLSYLDERTGQTANVTEVNAIITTNAQDRTVEFDGSLIWNRQPVRLAAYIRAPERLLTEGSPASLVLQAPQLLANFDGRLSFAKGLGLAGQLRISSADFPVAAAWTGIDAFAHLGIKTLNISGSTDISPKRIAISRAEFSINGAEAIGDVALQLGGGTPVLNASLVTETVNLDEDFVNGFDFSGLTKIPATLRIAAEKWSVGSIRLGAADVYAKTDKGVLEVKAKDVEIYGGTASVEGTLDGTQQLPSLKLGFHGAGLDSRSLLAECFGYAAASGTAEFTADLLASGKSLPELVSTLAGQVKFSAKNGSINGPDLPKLLSEVSRTMVEGWRAGATPFDELTATFKLKDGIAETTDLNLTGKDISLTGRGEADLLRRAIEFKIDPKFAAGAKVASLPVPLVVKGSWYKPKFYPDMPGILEDPDAAYKALKQLGAPAVTESN